MADENVEIKLELLDNISGRLDEAVNSLNHMQSMTSKVNTSFLNLSSIINVVGAAFGAIRKGVGAIIDVGAQAESAQVAFATLIGSEEKAAAVLGELNDYAAKTPFSQLQLAENARMLLGFGIDADKVNEKMRQLGDISMGNADKLGALSLVYGQVASANKLSGQDLLQFINAGFNPLKELADMTGQKYSELQGIMSKGGISAEHISAAIAHATGEGGKFHDMANKLSQTFSGRLSTVVGNLQQVGVKLFQAIEPYLMSLMAKAQVIVDMLPAVVDWLAGVLPVAVGWLQSIVQTCSEWAPAIAGVAAAVVAYNTYVKLAALATKAWAMANAALNVIMSLNPVGLVIAGIAALVAVVVACWMKFETFRAVVKTVWDTMKQFGGILKDFVVDRIKGVISGLGAMGSAIAKLFKGDFGGALETAKQGVKELSGYEAAANAFAKTKAMAGGVGKNFNARLAAEKKSSEDSKKSDEAEDPKSLANGDIIPPFQIGKIEVPGAAKNKAEATATGGTRNTNITINFGKEMVRMEFVGGYTENREEAARTIEEDMLRILQGAKASI